MGCRAGGAPRPPLWAQRSLPTWGQGSQGERPWGRTPKEGCRPPARGPWAAPPPPGRRGGSWAPRNFPSLPRGQWPLRWEGWGSAGGGERVQGCHWSCASHSRSAADSRDGAAPGPGLPGSPVPIPERADSWSRPPGAPTGLLTARRGPGRGEGDPAAFPGLPAAQPAWQTLELTLGLRGSLRLPAPATHASSSYFQDTGWGGNPGALGRHPGQTLASVLPQEAGHQDAGRRPGSQGCASHPHPGGTAAPHWAAPPYWGLGSGRACAGKGGPGSALGGAAKKPWAGGRPSGQLAHSCGFSLLSLRT